MYLRQKDRKPAPIHLLRQGSFYYLNYIKIVIERLAFGIAVGLPLI